MSSRADMYRQIAADYRQRAADAKQRAAQAKDPSIKIAFEHEAAFWLGLAEQLEWISREEGSPPRGKIIAKSVYRQTHVRSKMVADADCCFGTFWISDRQSSGLFILLLLRDFDLSFFIAFTLHYNGGVFEISHYAGPCYGVPQNHFNCALTNLGQQ